ncbi:MAG: protein kinase family protein [Syntrophales bacterium]
MENDIIKFIRRKDYKFIKEIGQGGFGTAILLKDEIIDSVFVCKKYTPYDPDLREEFFKNFIQEIKLLHLISHPNIVRVFNYYLYPEQFTGYILMEYIQGENIENHIYNHPETINEIFLQVIEGFRYLESENILHRDIRPQNILVDSNGKVKIIDFGFGKQIVYLNDFNKSISLNWWCEPPNDFVKNQYDHSTELYFIGKLFEKTILDNNIEVFGYKELLNKMIKLNQEDRIKSFNDIYRAILFQENVTIEFDESEKENYRWFADGLIRIISKIESNAQYINDIIRIIDHAENIYKKNILEEYLQNSVELVRCFIAGQYYYKKSETISTTCMKKFIDLLKKNPKEKQRIIINNLQNRFDTIVRYSELPFPIDEDVPF